MIQQKLFEVNKGSLVMNNVNFFSISFLIKKMAHLLQSLLCFLCADPECHCRVVYWGRHLLHTVVPARTREFTIVILHMLKASNFLKKTKTKKNFT